MTTESPSLSRRRFLSSAVIIGSFASLMVLADPNAQKVQAAEPVKRSLLAGYGTQMNMNHTANGKGIAKTYADAFSSTSLNKSSHFIGSDGKVKVAYSVIGLTNQFQVVDSLTGRNEYSNSIASSSPGSVSTVKWNGRTPDVYTISMGDMSRYSHSDNVLHSLGPVSSKAGAGYGPAFDNKGRAWIGEYPGAGVSCYDPSTGQKTEYPNLDAQSDYIRSISIMDEVVYCGTGAVSPKIVYFSVNNPMDRKIITVPNIASTGFVSEVLAYYDHLFVFFENVNRENQLSVYNVKTKQWVPFKYNNPHYRIMVNFENDGWVYFVAKTYPEARDSIVRWNPVTNVYETMSASPLKPYSWLLKRESNEVYAYMMGEDTVKGKYRSVRLSIANGAVSHNVLIDVKKSTYKVQDILASSDGKIYVGGYMGDGLQSINIETDVRWKSHLSSPIKQIEGMMEYGTNKIYIGSYGSAELITYTKTPETYKKIITLRDSYMQSRPYAWATAAGMVVNGTVPEYGLRGGALTVINPQTDTVVRVINKFIPEQSIVGLIGRGDIVYGTTSVKGGYGIADDTAPAKVFAYNVRTNTRLWVNSSLIHETEINSPIIIDGRLFVGVSNGVIELDLATGKALRTYTLFFRNNVAGYRNIRLGYVAKTNRLIHSSGGTITAINLNDNSRTLLYQGTPGTMNVYNNSRVFAAVNDGKDISEIHIPIYATFKDISQSGFQKEIIWISDKGIFTGYSDNTYRPLLAMTRESMATFMYRYAGSPAYTPPKISPFKDVPVTHPAYKEISWMRATGISTGWADGTYRPKISVTRESMAAFIYRLVSKYFNVAIAKNYLPPKISPFKDVSKSHPLYKEISWMRSSGISTGWADGTYRPTQNVLREQMAAFLKRADNFIIKYR